jgi:hypothetical protein
MQIRPCKYTWIIGLFLFGFRIFQSHAQVWGEAQVYFAEGGEFVLAAGGQRTVYRPDSLGEGGFSLHNGDIIQTGSGSFVDIRLTPSGKVIRVAENTVLSYNRTEGEGVSLGLSYGRLRLSDGWGGSGGRDILIQPGAAEVIFRNGDIGVDYTIQTGKDNSSREPVLRVYVFSGAADLLPRVRNSVTDPMGNASAVPRFQVNEGEVVSLESTAALSYVERKSLNTDIISYWDRHTSAAFPLLAQAEPDLPPQTVSPPETQVQDPAGRTRNMAPDYQSLMKTNAAKNGFIVGGFSLSLIGAGLQAVAYSHWNTDNPYNRNLNIYTGYGFLGLGVLSFGAALLANPQWPVSDAAE